MGERRAIYKGDYSRDPYMPVRGLNSICFDMVKKNSKKMKRVLDHSGTQAYNSPHEHGARHLPASFQ